jgi:hypothetical protein
MIVGNVEILLGNRYQFLVHFKIMHGLSSNAQEYKYEDDIITKYLNDKLHYFSKMQEILISFSILTC